jgi:putative ABC transport system permease protein
VLLSTPPWRRAPLALLRNPRLLAPTALAAAVLGLATTATPLYLASVGDAAFATARGQVCASTEGLRIHELYDPDGVDGPPAGQRAFVDDVARRTTGLPGQAPTHTIIADEVQVRAVGAGGAARVSNKLVSRTGASSAMQRLSDAGGAGIWLTDTTAQLLSVEAGDEVVLEAGSGTATQRVRGTFRNPSLEKPDPFWCATPQLVSEHGDVTPIPILLVDDPDEVVALNQALEPNRMERDVEVMPAPGIDLDGARSLAAELHRRFPTSNDTVVRAPSGFGALGPKVGLDAVIERTDQLESVTRNGITGIAAVAVVLGLAGVALAGAAWASTRAAELEVLGSLGVSSALVALKAGVEAVAPVLVASAAGAAVGALAVAGIGPDGFASTAAAARAAPWLALADTGGIALFMATAALLHHRRHRAARPSTSGAIRRTVPWELLAITVAGAALYEARRATPSGSSLTDVAGVDALVVLLPLLLAAGTGGLVGRAVAVAVRHWPHGHRPRPMSRWLALARLRRSAGTAATVTAITVAVATFVYAGAAADASDRTQRAEAGAAVGADVNARLTSGSALPSSLPGPSTVVRRFNARLPALGDRSVTVLAVDPSTWAATAFFDSSFSPTGIDALAALLSAAGRDGRVPALLAGGAIPEAGLVELDGSTQPPKVAYDVVARPATLPGLDAGLPLLVVPVAGVAAADVIGARELWVKGDAAAILDALSRSDAKVVSTTTIAAITGAGREQAIGWTFTYLRALGAFVGALAIAGIATILLSRQRALTLAHALGRRMGVRASTERRALARELATLVLPALLAGVGTGWLATWLVRAQLDPSSALPPATIVSPPVVAALVATVAMAAGAAATIAAAQWAARRADVTGALRDAG